MNRYMLSLDQGTTSSRAIVFDHAGQVVGMAQKEFAQIYPQSGWVEHDAHEIWHLTKAQPVRVRLCLTTQGRLLVWHKRSLRKFTRSRAGLSTMRMKFGRRSRQSLWRSCKHSIYLHRTLPLSASPINAKPRCCGINTQAKPCTTSSDVCSSDLIVWQDRRTAALCASLSEQGYDALINQKTGLRLDPYFSATKLKWLLDNVAGTRELAAQNRLAFGTIDTWLIWNLTAKNEGGALHITDVSNAARTMLFNIRTRQWDEELLTLFDIPASVLPEVRASSEVYGYTTEVFDAPIAIAGIAGDQQAALFGQTCWQAGMVKNTYGTGCFMLMNTGGFAAPSTHNLLTTIAWQIGDEICYARGKSVMKSVTHSKAASSSAARWYSGCAMSCTSLTILMKSSLWQPALPTAAV